MSYNNGPYFIATWQKPLPSKAAEKRAYRAIRKIDPSADLVCVKIPGNSVRVWLERPNDGTNDYPHQRDRKAQMIAAVEAEMERSDEELSES
jgi:hypothetical protein